MFSYFKGVFDIVFNISSFYQDNNQMNQMGSAARMKIISLYTPIH